MKRKLCFLWGFCLVVLHCMNMQADSNTINFYIRPYPGVECATYEKIYGKVHRIGKMPSAIVRSCLRSTCKMDGILALYNGEMAWSNRNGLIQLFRRHLQPDLAFLVTYTVHPVFDAKGQIGAMAWSDDSRTALYSVERKQDSESGAWFWLVEQVALPASGRIPDNAIVILAKAKEVFVPQGITLTTDSAQWLLPTIYVKKGFNRAIQALRAMKLKWFFSPVVQKSKKQTLGYQSLGQRG